ncbi:MAG: rod shape-determining protein RodA [Acidobacteriales bacterium]|nr:rod shape-determining protein RodA [Terriglobales bacterium]
MRRFASYRDFDWTLLGFVLLICLIGIVQIYSASVTTKFAGVHTKQIYWVLAGLVAMFLISFIDYHKLLENVHWAYLLLLGALIAVPVIGVTALGAKRWIRLPGVGLFQPSEWMKLVLIIALAQYISSLNPRDVTWTDIFKALAIVGLPLALVLKQPDLGTSLTFLPALGLLLFLGGMKPKQIAAFALAGLLIAPVVWFKGLKDYQKDRLVNFVHPENDPKGSGYQIRQSLIAVGAGGIWGKGMAQGSQTQLNYLPVTHTDFIYATLAEEQGFVGASLVLLLYFVVLMRLVQNAQMAADRAGTLLIMGIAAVLVFHILVNVGMVVGIMPVTGIPLPLMSYGGSSVMFTFLALGIVMNVRMRRFVN